MYQPYWVCGSIGCLVQLIYPLLWNAKSNLLPSLGCSRPRNRGRPCCGMKNHVYCHVWGALVPIIEGASGADHAFMAVWTPNCMCQPYWARGSKGYLVHIAHIPTLMWNQNRVYGLVWYTLLRDWKPLWETSTCVRRLICPEGYVSSLNKCNPIQSLQLIQDRWIEKYS